MHLSKLQDSNVDEEDIDDWDKLFDLNKPREDSIGKIQEKNFNRKARFKCKRGRFSPKNFYYHYLHHLLHYVNICIDDSIKHEYTDIYNSDNEFELKNNKHLPPVELNKSYFFDLQKMQQMEQMEQMHQMKQHYAG